MKGPIVRTIAVINQKGGCGKTTTAINLAAALAELDQRTLLVDVDPQGHCALGLAVPESQIESTIGEAMTATAPGTIDPAQLLWQVSRRLDLIPSTVSLARVERQLSDKPDRDVRLASVLRLYEGKYDFCLIDCPPNIGLLTFNALRAAGEVIIPVEAGYFALKGARKQAELVRVLTERCNQTVAVHVLPTLYDESVPLSRDIARDLKRHFGDRVTPAPIRYDVKLKEAASYGQPISEYDPKSTGYRDYEALARHLKAKVPAAAVGPLAGAEAPAAPGGGNGSTTTAKPDGNGRAPTDEPPQTDRAAELVQRAKALAQRTQRMADRLATDPEVQRVERQQVLDQRPAATAGQQEELDQKLARFYGVQVTGQGTLFVQPQRKARRVSIAGDFNGWSPVATPMQLNPKLGVWEACVTLPPGRYQYRIVVDDEWITDPHNTITETNPFGQMNNIVEVTTHR